MPHIIPDFEPSFERPLTAQDMQNLGLMSYENMAGAVVRAVENFDKLTKQSNENNRIPPHHRLIVLRRLRGRNF